jgi:hypothetical protein
MKKNLARHCLIVALVVLAAGATKGSRVLAQAETLPKGRGIVSAFYTRSSTETRFDFLGDRTRVIPPAGPDFRGFTRTNVLSLDLAYGITRRLEAHVTIPIINSRLASVAADGKIIESPDQSPNETGIGNIRFGIRYNFVSEPFFLTAKVDIKTPASAANLEKAFSGTTLPIDEGQTDIDLTGQISKNFMLFNRSLRVGGEAGIRLRRTQKDGALDTFTNESLPVSPANEFIYNFQVNYGLIRRVSLTLAGNGIVQRDYDVPFRFIRVGENGDIKTVGTQGNLPTGLKPDFEKQTGRRIFSLGPLVNFSVTPRTIITGGVLFAVSGRNFPAGQFLILGISRLF